jgi:hypothetical protein
MFLSRHSSYVVKFFIPVIWEHKIPVNKQNKELKIFRSRLEAIIGP